MSDFNGEDRRQVVSILALESIAGSLLPVYSFIENLEIDLGGQAISTPLSC